MRWLLGVMVWGVMGCATQQGATSVGMAKFPTREALRKVMERPPRLDLARLQGATAQSWVLQGPFPDAVSQVPVAPTTSWEQSLTEVVPAARGGLLESHACLAREAARFFAAKGDLPPLDLRSFMVTRCSVGANVMLRTLKGEVPENVSDAEWLAAWKPQLASLANQGGSHFGIAGARVGSSAGVVVVSSAPQVRLESKVIVSHAGLSSVIVRGRLMQGSVDRIEARINHGEFDSEGCRTPEIVEPPAFSFECRVRPGDTETRVEVAAFEPGRLLGRSALTFAVWPTGAPTNEWKQGPSSEFPQGTAASRFLTELNLLRERAGRPVLTEAKEQSTVADVLAPSYFGHQFGDAVSGELADTIMLGLSAGWEVPIAKVGATFGSGAIVGSRELSRLVRDVLESPFARQAALHPRATHAAVGAVDAPNLLGVIFSTYIPVGTFVRRDAETALVTRLNTERLAQQLPLAQWTLWPTDEGAVIEQRLGAGEWTPEQALRHALNASAAVATDSVSGTVQLVDDLEHFVFPTEVLKRRDINVFVTVAPYREASWPHTRFVVCFVVARSGSVQTASR